MQQCPLLAGLSGFPARVADFARPTYGPLAILFRFSKIDWSQGDTVLRLKTTFDCKQWILSCFLVPPSLLPSLPPSIAAVCWTLHYAKRILETVFVHRFSHNTMPIRNLFKVGTVSFPSTHSGSSIPERLFYLSLKHQI